MQRLPRFNILLFLFVLSVFPGASSHAAVTVLNYWRLGESDPGATNGVTATNTVDSVGTNNLTFTGTPWYTNDVAATALSHTASSLSVNFTNGAYATNSLILTNVDNFGVECWVKPMALGIGQVIVYNGSTGGTGDGGWGILINSAGMYQVLFGGVIAFGTAPANINTWTHVAAVRASGVTTLYVNGAASDTNNLMPGVSKAGGFALGVPPQAPTAPFFNGLIDEVRVFTFAAGQFSTNDLLLNQLLPPVVTTTGPTLLTTSTATLNGTVNPSSLPTTAWFQWGPIQFPYGYTTAVTNLGSGNATLPVSQSLSGLTQGLTYHYRLVASNAAGVVRGLDSRFWAPVLTVNSNNPLYLKHQTWADPGVTVYAAPSGVAAGSAHSLALKADGTVVGWGDNSFAEQIPSSVSNVTAIAAGGYFSLALKADGTVAGWGTNGSGQITLPASATNVVAIAAGTAYGLALKADGTVIGWGDNTFGQTNIPASATNVIAIVASGAHSLALKGDGTVVAWGNGQTVVPVSATNVTAIAAGDSHSLALKADGTVVGWGNAGQDQLPVPANATNVVAIAAGGTHSLALKADGTIVGWGDYGFGPINPPANATNVVAIATSIQHSLALRADGTVIGWGSDSSGQINIPSGLDIVNLPVASSDNVNTNAPGGYQVNYFVTNTYGVTTASRSVMVIDSPTITNVSASALQLTTNGANIFRIMRFSASVNPNGSPTIVSIAYGLTAGYGAVSSTNILPGLFTPQTTTIDVPISPVVTFHWSVVATNGMDSIPGSASSLDQISTVPPAFILGDANGDGIVDQSELDAVYSNYLQSSPWLLMTNVAGLGQTNVSFALSNSVLGAYSVQVSTDLTDWQFLGPAIPRYLFTDTNAPTGPQRYYRLSYP
jgi:alpha-tubulin suppressor-like RCC1 family protein